MRRHPQGVTSLARKGGAPAASPEAERCIRAETALWRYAAIAQIVFIVALSGFIAACASDEEAKKPPPDPGVAAQLQPVSDSAVKGFASFKAYDGGVWISINVSGNPGSVRVVIHSTGICSSPNGFSAGPPWIPPGAAEPPMIRMAISDNLYGTTSAQLPGIKVDGPDGIRGKSVVVHRGNSGSLDAQPNVPNNRVACGVIETNKPLTF
jgi:Cu/Zn superoxide dismutase